MQSSHYFFTLFFLPSFLQIVASSVDHSLEYYVLEELPPGSPVGNLVHDLGLGSRYNRSVLDQLHLSFLTSPNLDRQYFSINEKTGEITNALRIDREALCPPSGGGGGMGGATSPNECVVNFDVAVQPFQYFQIVKVRVEIVDQNDHDPAFPERRVKHQISELAELGTGFSIPSASDPDSGKNGVQRYEIVPSGGDGTRRGTTDGSGETFELSVRSTADGGVDIRLILKEKLDREIRDRYDVRVMAVDGGSPPKTGSILVSVSVQDANDNNPEFENSSYEVRVPEDLPEGSVIARLRATDRDTGLNAVIVYEFSSHTTQEHGHLFGIKSDTGKVYLKQALNYETSSIYLLSVTAHDRGPDSLPAHASLVVRVDDVNDNAPIISLNTLTSSSAADVKENAEIGTFVAHLSVVDADSGENGRVQCSVNHQDFTLQQIYSSELKVVTARSLDRELTNHYSLSISCEDFGPAPSHTSQLPLEVKVIDENDNAPIFEQNEYEVTLVENSLPGTKVVQVKAVDPDLGLNGEITYQLDKDNSILPPLKDQYAFLSIDPISGLVTCAKTLDHEEVPEISVNILAVDKGQPSRSSTTRLKVNVKDIDDNEPRFIREHFILKIRENEPAGSEVGVVKAKDPDSAPHNLFTYWLIGSTSNEYAKRDRHSKDAYHEPFTIDPETGMITTTQVLNRESVDVHNLTIGVRPIRDIRGDELNNNNARKAPIGKLNLNELYSNTALVTVLVIDVNDHAPKFIYPSFGNETVAVSSQTPVGGVIAKLWAEDLDIGLNGNLTYHIVAPLGSRVNAFSVVTDTGELVVSSDLSVVTMETFLLRVTVRDLGTPQLSDNAQLRVVVSKDIPYIPPPTYPPRPPGSALVDLGLSNVTNLLTSEDMVIVLAFTLAIILLAIIIIVAIICLYRKHRINHLRHHGNGSVRKPTGNTDWSGCQLANPKQVYKVNDAAAAPIGRMDDDGCGMQTKPLLGNSVSQTSSAATSVGNGSGSFLGNGRATAVVNAYVKLNGCETPPMAVGEGWSKGGGARLSYTDECDERFYNSNQSAADDQYGSDSAQQTKSTLTPNDASHLPNPPSWIIDISSVSGNQNNLLTNERASNSKGLTSPANQRQNPVVVFIKDQSDEKDDLNSLPGDSLVPTWRDITDQATNHSAPRHTVGGNFTSSTYQTLPMLHHFPKSPSHGNHSRPSSRTSNYSTSNKYNNVSSLSNHQQNGDILSYANNCDLSMLTSSSRDSQRYNTLGNWSSGQRYGLSLDGQSRITNQSDGLNLMDGFLSDGGNSDKNRGFGTNRVHFAAPTSLGSGNRTVQNSLPRGSGVTTPNDCHDYMFDTFTPSRGTLDSSLSLSQSYHSSNSRQRQPAADSYDQKLV